MFESCFCYLIFCLFCSEGGYYQFCITKSPYSQLVSHDDNLGDQVLEIQGMSTNEFWNSCYGKGDYMNKRAFFEPIGDGRYNALRIKESKYPCWMITGIVIGVICLIMTIISAIDGWYILAFIFDVIAAFIVFVLAKNKCCDVSGQQRARLAKGRKENRGDCGGGCGAACAAYGGGDGCGGGGGGGDGGGCGGDGGGCGGDGGCGGGCGGCGGCGG